MIKIKLKQKTKYLKKTFDPHIQTCKWIGTNLKVTKSHGGQNRAPPNNVGSKSRFNLAIISSPLSPDNSIKIITQNHH